MWINIACMSKLACNDIEIQMNHFGLIYTKDYRLEGCLVRMAWNLKHPLIENNRFFLVYFV